MKRMVSLVATASIMIGLLTGCSTSSENSATNAQANTSGASSASEVNWPSSSTIYADVPAKAGGGTDLITRYVTAAWAPMINVNFVVTNYDTAEVGAQHTAKAKADGTTFSMAATTSMDMYLSGASGVNPMEDFTCIAKVIDGGPQVLITQVDAPYSNLKELKKYVEAHPDDVTCGCSLGGTSQLMWIQLTQSMGNIKLNYVQCSSEADKLSNVAGNSIDVANCSLNNAISYEKANKIKVLGILSYSDKAGKDDIDSSLGDQYLTTWEQGFPNSSWMAGYYLVGPKGMSDELAETVNEKIQGIDKVDSFIKGMDSLSMVIDVKNLKDSRADYETEWETQKKLCTAAGINVR